MDKEVKIAKDNTFNADAKLDDIIYNMAICENCLKHQYRL